MIRRNALVMFSLGLVAMGAAPAAEEPAINRQVGSQVGDFKAEDVTTHEQVSLYSFQGKKAAVLIFMGVDCPVGNQYMPRLEELAKTYQPQGVVFLGINSNAHDTTDQVADHARQFHANFPVLKDTRNTIADQLQAERTCEVLVLDAKTHLRYRGAIDDQYGYGKRRPQPLHAFLSDALDAVLAGKSVETSAATVVGCPIDRAVGATPSNQNPKVRSADRRILEARKADDQAAHVGPVTYSGQVATILQEKCQRCHRPEAAGPFSLLSYDDATRRAALIREVVEERRMPPWHADPRYGHFANDRSLTAEQRAMILAWVDQGTPLGEAAAVPPPKAFAKGWVVGEPDIVFSIPEPYTVPAQGVLDYQRIRVPTNFTEDKWVQSIEPQPTDRSVVHHIIVYVDDKQPAKEGRKRINHLAGYAPGEMPSIYPPGIAKKIPAGSDFIFEIHYTPMGKIKIDRSRVGLIFAKTPPEHEAITRDITNPRFKIPPGADNHEVKSRWTFRQDAHLLSFMPHMHLRGKDFEYRVTYPDGRSEILLSIPAYDFAWQSFYALEQPLAMPKGTVVDCTAHFDNSANNLANPDPTKEVGWGDQTFNEMMIGYIDFYNDTPIPPAPVVGSTDQPTSRP